MPRRTFPNQTTSDLPYPVPTATPFCTRDRPGDIGVSERLDELAAYVVGTSGETGSQGGGAEPEQGGHRLQLLLTLYLHLLAVRG